ncbi:MAG: hypothetical protein M9930_13065 [Anaerolineae bacterium]|nr:hypothetical protein [Anaerolineae bacterium]
MSYRIICTIAVIGLFAVGCSSPTEDDSADVQPTQTIVEITATATLTVEPATVVPSTMAPTATRDSSSTPTPAETPTKSPVLQTVDALAAGPPTSTSTPTVDQADLLSAEEITAAVQPPYESYRKAMLDKDADAVLAVVSSDVVKFYEELRQAALLEGNIWLLFEMATLPKVELLSLRHEFMRSELELLTGLEVFVHQIEIGVPLLTVDPVDFEQLNIESTAVDRAKATVDSVDNVQLTFEFQFEDGVWRIGPSNRFELQEALLFADVDSSSENTNLFEDKNSLLAEVMKAQYGDNFNDMSFYGPLTSTTPTIAELESLLKDTVSAYMAAINAQNGETVASLISEDTLAHYEYLRQLALEASASDFTDEPIVNILQVLTLRLNHTRTELESLEPKDVLISIVQSDVQTIETFAVDVDRLLLHLIRSDSGFVQLETDDPETPIVHLFGFGEVNGEWKLFLSDAIEQASEVTDAAYAEQGMTAELLVEAIYSGETESMRELAKVIDGPLD